MSENRSELLNLYEFTRAELTELLADWGQPAYRAEQLWQWMYEHLAADFAEMTNLPRQLRDHLARHATLQPLRVLEELVSRDQLTRKYLLELPDGETIESVLMLYERRRTACISTQVGCPIRCDFCATGKSGFRRNLTAGEIVAQVIYIARAARPFAPADSRPLTNVVYMGMGEPLLNLDNVLKSLRILTDPKGFNLGDRHITISTAGVVPGILRLAQEPMQVRLAISLHAPTDELRDTLVPLNRRYPIAQVRQALQTYFEHTGRRITIEYALIKEVNDHKAQAAELAKLFAGLPVHVNLIPVNPVENSPYRPSPPARVKVFVEELERHNIPCSVRLRRGLDVQAGCGQLRSRHLSQTAS